MEMVSGRDTDAAPESVAVLLFHADAQAAVARAVAGFGDAGLTWDIIVVGEDDRCAPTANAERAAASGAPPQSGGDWGNALLRACAQTNHQLICTIDRHTLYAAAAIPGLLRTLQEFDADMAVGVRVGTRHPVPAYRRLLPWFMDMTAADALGMPVLDLNSGLRVIHRRALNRLRGRLTEDFAPPAALTLDMLAADAPVVFLPLDPDPAGRSPYGLRLWGLFRLAGRIVAVGFGYAPWRTAALLARMALMLLMMLGMGAMMLWMMGMLPVM